MTSDVRVVAATDDQVRPLRWAVLRWPGYDEVPAYDLDPATRHVAALDHDGTVIGVATVFPAPMPDREDGLPAGAVAGDWQLRGMAVDPAQHGRGIGRQVITAAVAAARADGATRLWAHARVSALPFYLASGWVATGAVYVLGPLQIDHRFIHLDL